MKVTERNKQMQLGGGQGGGEGGRILSLKPPSDPLLGGHHTAPKQRCNRGIFGHQRDKEDANKQGLLLKKKLMAF